MNAFLQWMVVAMIVGWSLHAALRRLMPGTTRSLYVHLATLLKVMGASRLAHWLLTKAPAVPACDSACSGCDTPCSKMKLAEEEPVKWRSPPSSGACH